MVIQIAAIGVLNSFSELHAAPFLFYVVYFFVAIVLLLYGYVRVWFFARRRVLRQAITTHYEPPFGLNPAELSYLFQKKLNQSDFGGLLVHMAQRGVVHFRKHDGGKQVLPGPKYEGSLKSYEKLILDVLDEHKSVSVSDLLSGYQTIFQRDRHYNTFEKQVAHELTKGRHVKKIRMFSRLFTHTKPTIALLAALVWVPLLATWIRSLLLLGTSDLASAFDVVGNIITATGIAVIPAVIVAVAISGLQGKAIGRRRVFRLRPEEMWAQLVGYRQYVVHIRSGKLRFEAKHTEKTANLNTLPYAIALDQVPHWKDIIT